MVKRLCVVDFRVRVFAGPNHPNVHEGRLVLETHHADKESAAREIVEWQKRVGDQYSRIELIDMRRMGNLTCLTIGADTKIDWHHDRDRIITRLTARQSDDLVIAKRTGAGSPSPV